MNSPLKTMTPSLRAFLILYHSTPTPPALRRGQFLFNTLNVFNPTLASKMRGGPLDPFYDDTRIDEFLAHVILWWEEAS